VLGLSRATEAMAAMLTARSVGKGNASEIRSCNVGVAISHQTGERPPMTVLSNDPMPLARTITIYRPASGTEGYREVHDKTSSITVSCFPWKTAREVRLQPVPACYILADHGSVYIGETSDIRGRLAAHIRDSDKNFAREAYVVTGVGSEGKRRFNSTAAVYFQYHLTHLALQANLVDVIKGNNPQTPDADEYDRAWLGIFLQQSQSLLFDAGCRAFKSNFASQRRSGSATVDTAGPAGTMEIDVIGVAPISGQLELAYAGLWARGYESQRGFVVLAGSEIRADINPTAWDWIDEDRSKLRAAGALMAIPGLTDRERLCVAVQFDSASSAAKVVTGSRDAFPWVTPRLTQPMLNVA
jgi:predicted GIY-YIG superfamily endonuclease